MCRLCGVRACVRACVCMRGGGREVEVEGEKPSASEDDMHSLHSFVFFIFFQVHEEQQEGGYIEKEQVVSHSFVGNA